MSCELNSYQWGMCLIIQKKSVRLATVVSLTSEPAAKCDAHPTEMKLFHTRLENLKIPEHL